jgi:SPP1 family predicted phage head-tail adaptor
MLNSLKTKITIERPVFTPDGGGGHVRAWEAVGTFRASVEPYRGAEQLLADKQTGVTLYQITIRKRSVSTGWRVLWKGMTMNIREVMVSESPYLEFVAEAGAIT